MMKVLLRAIIPTVITIGVAVTCIMVTKQIAAGQQCQYDLSNETKVRPIVQDRRISCRHDQYSCPEKCIDVSKKCDGVRDCLDGSDEDCVFFHRGSIPCGPPPLLKHGHYVINTSEADNLTSVDQHVVCDEGYELQGNPIASCKQGIWTKPECIPMCYLKIDPSIKYQCFAKVYPTEELRECNAYEPDGSVVRPKCNHPDFFSPEKLDSMKCNHGTWDYEPKCFSASCKLEFDISIIYNCIIYSTNTSKERPCNNLEPPGTVVRPECNKPDYYPNEVLTVMKCDAGEWDYEPKCSPECGTITPRGTAQMVGGRRAHQGELPWHTGIYIKSYDPYKLICGGTLIANNLVISAAHCFYESKPMPPRNYAVAAGKIFRPYNEKMDNMNGAQRSNVYDIKIPDHFRGRSTNFQHDIALVILTEPFTYRPYVKPVCLDLENDFERRQLVTGKLGKVAGWGLHQVDGVEGSVALKVVELPYIPVGDCLDRAPPFFQAYITGDKMCAGYENNGTALCQGDSGGGLVFPAKDRGSLRFYLRGVASVAPDSNNNCNDKTFTAFTQVTQHAYFIMEHLNVYKKRLRGVCLESEWRCDDGTCIPLKNKCDGSEDFPDHSDEDTLKCNRSPSKELRCILPEYPTKGSYSTNLPNALPGHKFLHISLNVTCHRGYGVKNSPLVFCYDGMWSGSMPKCQRVCKLQTHPSVNYKCLARYNDTIITRACRDYEFEDTTVKPECNRPYYYSPMALSNMRCISGYWDYMARCLPECGRMVLRTELGPDPRPITRGEFSWHIGLYIKTEKPFKLVCGGSLVSENMIITAASCFWKRDRMIPAGNFVAVAGKQYEDYNNINDVDSTQKSDVNSIFVPARFTGDASNFQNDIALVTVANKFSYTFNVRPVCLDFDINFERLQLRPGSMGMVAAWGLKDNHEVSNSLKVAELPYVDVEECIANIRHVNYFTPDKICAGYQNNSIGACSIATGGGLVFIEKSRGNDRAYIRGVISPGSNEENQTCSEKYTLFTQVVKNEHFIKEFLTRE